PGFERIHSRRRSRWPWRSVRRPGLRMRRAIRILLTGADVVIRVHTAGHERGCADGRAFELDAQRFNEAHHADLRRRVYAEIAPGKNAAHRRRDDDMRA